MTNTAITLEIDNQMAVEKKIVIFLTNADSFQSDCICTSGATSTIMMFHYRFMSQIWDSPNLFLAIYCCAEGTLWRESRCDSKKLWLAFLGSTIDNATDNI